MQRTTLAVFCDRFAPLVTRLAIALIYGWFGLLKLFGVSPAEELIRQTFSFLPGGAVILALGAWEVVIAVLLLFPRTVWIALLFLILHLPGTFLSYFTATELCFTGPFVFTDLGEFILKNLMVIGAVLFLASVYAPGARTHAHDSTRA
ncbi:hypothetical protein [Oleiharenicola lentus]|uniref:hypothetical protein n=1 Tax=Oleiharenicola lentus TaxID=2508720 RepID=UPI003F67C880